MMKLNMDDEMGLFREFSFLKNWSAPLNQRPKAAVVIKIKNFRHLYSTEF